MPATTLLTDIPVSIDAEALLPRLHLKPQAPEAAEFRALAAEAQRIARPRAGFVVGYIESKDPEGVVIAGERFSSRVLRVNLDGVYRVFAYIATCSLELHQWAATLTDVLHQFWAEELKVTALRAATTSVYGAIEAENPGKMASMNPGSLADWPLPQQKPFFRLLGELPDRLGVTLSDSCIMTPNKSVTGFRFGNDNDYVNCRLCPREDCPGRAAPYDPELYARRYEQGS
ncbi:MAG: vitamin B12 dependent methionine synthase [Anaerolineae bacterium]